MDREDSEPSTPSAEYLYRTLTGRIGVGRVSSITDASNPGDLCHSQNALDRKRLIVAMQVFHTAAWLSTRSRELSTASTQ